MKTRRAKSLHQRNQFGFSLIEVMISMAVMAVGLLGVLGVFGLAVAANQSSQEDLIARQVASEAMESIFTAGPTYGIVGVSGDTSSCKTATGTTCPNGGVQCLNEPGFDGIVGTADDIILSLSNYTRTIAITPLTDTSGNVIQTLVQVTVTITYSAPNSPALKNYVLTEYISEYH
jgi:prepilin-type N-terminal cleavage/methylation domain-containing protein